MIVRLSLSLLAAAAAVANAGATEAASATGAVSADARVVVDCRAPQMPSLQAVGALIDSNNAGQMAAERERLLHVARRECLRGLSRVVFERGDVQEPQIAFADPAWAR